MESTTLVTTQTTLAPTTLLQGAAALGAPPAEQGGCCNLDIDTKIYLLIILGGILQTAAFAGIVSSIALACMVNPFIALVIIPSLAVGALGIALSKTQKYVDGSIFIPQLMTPPFIPHQPIGVHRQSNNCWANASMQLCMQSPLISQAMLQMPREQAFHTFCSAYNSAQQNQQIVSAEASTQAIRMELHRHNAGSVPAESHIQGDANEALGFIFDILHEDFERRFAEDKTLETPSFLNPITLQQTTKSSNETATSQEPATQITLHLQNYLDYQTRQRDLPQDARITLANEALFIHYLLDPYFNDDTEHTFTKRQFDTLPQEMIFHLARFRNDGSKIAYPLPIPLQLHLPKEYVKDATAETIYEPCAFVYHGGSTLASAHYTVYTKAENGIWWEINDNQVLPITNLHTIEYQLNRSYMILFRKAAQAPSST
jgi:hypothetical protein